MHSSLIEVVYFPEVAKDPRFDGLDKRLKQLEAGPSAPQHDGWVKRNAHWFGLLGPIVTVSLFIVGAVFGWFNSIFDGRVTAKLNEPNGINAQLLQLNTSVNTANGELSAIRKLWEQELKKTSELLPGQLKDALPQTANALKAARVLNLPLPPKLASLQRSLEDTKSNVPGYWAAASEFISYRSSQESNVSPESQLPRCYDVPPAIQGIVGQSFNMWSRPPEWQNCLIDLEEEMPDKWWDSIVGMKPYKDLPQLRAGATQETLRLTDCLIRYRGGAVPMRIYSLLGFATFLNCLFEFDFSTTPPDHGQKLSEALLASPSFKNVNLHVSLE